MSVLKNKATAIRDALVAKGVITTTAAHFFNAEQIIEDALREDGGFRLLEGPGNEIKTIVQVKDQSGRVIAEQG